MKYIILEGSTAASLQKKVQQCIDARWEPLGSFSNYYFKVPSAINESEAELVHLVVLGKKKVTASLMKKYLHLATFHGLKY